MESIRNTLFMLVFMWMGIILTRTTLAGTPKDEWLSATIKLGLMITVLVVVVELIYQGLKRRQRRNQASVMHN